MVWLTVNGSANTTVHGPMAAVFDILVDVVTSGRMFPGVDRIEDLGEGRFRWFLADRKTLGRTFQGRYTTQHENNGKDEISWKTVEGNVKTSGVWRLSGTDGSVRVRVDVESTVDAPVPSLLKKPAMVFAQRELSTGVEKQLANIKSAVEAAERR